MESLKRFGTWSLFWAVLFLGGGLLFSAAIPVIAQSFPDADVEFYIDPEEGEEAQTLTVGDRIRLRLEITHPAGSEVTLPEVEEPWADIFEVIEQTPARTVDNGDGTATTGKYIVVSLFQPGVYQTPALIVTHRKPDETEEKLASPVIPINITTVLTEDTELRDLKAQAQVPTPAIWPWILAGILLFMFLLGLLLVLGAWWYRRWQRRTMPEMVPGPALDTRPPEVIAYAELERIEALNLPLQNRFKEHYSLISACLRRYIERRYKIPALEQTTSELRMAFKDQELDIRSRHAHDFLTIFTESDFVKFARYKPRMEESERMIKEARDIVKATTPQPEPAITPSPPSSPDPKPEGVA